ncbi:BON domain-containing protein [Sphingomonas gilva]|uniref:BON domain-containing protein n=1 Tax=Sphingomonas gilva TaxID=2305907 RepID=A0A396RPY1_9SPHN|nr:type II and III secretion system protein family protein [Sphingomonas gilva]RHW17342.1 BON domain-containing protein [Sphingomonas gilva]
MRTNKLVARTSLGTALAAALAVGLAATASAPAAAQVVARTPNETIQISVGQGRMVKLDAPMSDLFVASDEIADVQVRSPTQLFIFGKKAGETTVYATSKSGKVVYSTTIRVGANFGSLDAMLDMAMPEADITASTMNGVVLLTGTVLSPSDSAEAERLAKAFVGEETTVISRLKTATPLQVNLQVKIAEVSRDFAKNIGNNLITRDTGGFKIGVSGREFGSIGNVDTSDLPQLDASSRFGLPAGSITLPFDPRIGDFVYPNSGTAFDFSDIRSSARTSLGFAGRFLGLDIADVLDLGERDGQVTTLASPNLTALSGETASFLAGGEIPIPISQGLGAVTVEYKQYGVSLAFTPTVLADGRISMRVRPEVSQLSAAGSVTLGGVTIPGLTTRRAETTLEMGSGQSMMIGGLLSNSVDNSIDKTPGLGDVPILGSLFRSNAFRRSETELVIVITPYLVKPVNAGDIKLPTDGFKAPTDLERVLLGQTGGGKSGEERPKPTTAPSAGPVIGSAPLPAGPTLPAPPVQAKAPPPATGPKTASSSATPGFSF